VVLDAFSRRIVGWSMATTLATRLVLDALNMALRTRRPRGVIHHSDQGSQYTSIGVLPGLPRGGRAVLAGAGAAHEHGPDDAMEEAAAVGAALTTLKAWLAEVSPGSVGLLSVG
jgi:transposase InsO family protein